MKLSHHGNETVCLPRTQRLLVKARPYICQQCQRTCSTSEVLSSATLEMSQTPSSGPRTTRLACKDVQLTMLVRCSASRCRTCVCTCATDFMPPACTPRARTRSENPSCCPRRGRVTLTFAPQHTLSRNKSSNVESGPKRPAESCAKIAWAAGQKAQTSTAAIRCIETVHPLFV